MTDISFDDFVDQQLAKTEPSINWSQRRDDWVDHLVVFYHLAEEFLRKYIEQDKVHLMWATKQINEEYVGSYDVASLEIQIGVVNVRFDPIGTNLIGVKGRVDMHGPNGTVKFVLVPETASSPMLPKDELEPVVEEWVWKISTRHPNIRYIKLVEESFLSAIMEVANA